jgi:TolB-like protein/class 3 adenylate cyclase
MTEKRAQRRLAAILAADVVGYSRLMEQDEAGTLSALKARRNEVLVPTVVQHNGRVVKVMGDGVLVEFGSAVNAVQCAVELQRAFTEVNQGVPEDQRIVLRIGINLGDVIVEGSDLYGDGVNVAARLEGLAEPGGIYISGSVYEQVTGKLMLAFDDLSEHTLKNIMKPVRVYRAAMGGTEKGAVRPALALPDKPSIAVLPFANMSNDTEQEYFADGMVEDLITALSRVHWLFVIARNSSFTYKGKAADVKQVGRELGVRYVLEGSVRKAGNRVRITGQLIDASTGGHLWANQFDGELENIFDLQDKVTASVVGAMAPKLEQAEIERSRRKPTENYDAYDYYLRGLASVHAIFGGTREAVSEALRLFNGAIERDPTFAAAYGMAAWCHVLRKNYGWSTDDAQEVAEVERLAQHATRLAKDDAVALYTGGFAYARIVGYLDTGAALIDRALVLDPNLAAAWHLSGWVRIYRGEPDTAIEHMGRAIRLNPLDPLIYGMQNGTAAAHFLAARYDEATKWAEKALTEHTSYLPALRMLASSHACAGRLAQAQDVMVRIRQIDPEFHVSNLANLVPFRGPQDVARYIGGLRAAGLPE